MPNIRIVYSINQAFIQKHPLTKTLQNTNIVFSKIHVKIQNIKFIAKTMIIIKTQYLLQKTTNNPIKHLLQNVINNKFSINFK